MLGNLINIPRRGVRGWRGTHRLYLSTIVSTSIVDKRFENSYADMLHPFQGK